MNDSTKSHTCSCYKRNDHLEPKGKFRKLHCGYQWIKMLVSQLNTVAMKSLSCSPVPSVNCFRI